MINKQIHYIWLGGNRYNSINRICINSWKRNLSDYKITLWDETNLDLAVLSKKHRFLNECLERKLWAFASDFLRLYILYNEGGIYLDTDVEVVKNFDSLLNNSFFVGLEQGDYIGTGVIGAEKGSVSVKRLLDFYDSEIWDVDYYNNPIIFKKLIDEDPSFFKNATILPIDYFSPYNPYGEDSEISVTGNTVCIHWYSANWGMSRKGYVFLNTKHCKKPLERFIQIIRKNIGYFKRII